MKINDVNRFVIQSKIRNQKIIEDVIDCLEKKRIHLVLTKSREHAAWLYEHLHRDRETKKDVIIYDYVDANISLEGVLVLLPVKACFKNKCKIICKVYQLRYSHCIIYKK